MFNNGIFRRGLGWLGDVLEGWGSKLLAGFVFALLDFVDDVVELLALFRLDPGAVVVPF